MSSDTTSEWERRLDAALAPCAMLHARSGGRLHGPEPHPHRTCYQRDRDRVIHSKAFRRLGYKTQVFVNHAGDNYRTRLTHSLEVAQISRSVCGALGLNADFAETIALAHDLGHTPFGHAGQEALNRLMREHGGFEHNCQSLRIVSRLETRYLQFEGLNLTRASLKGMMKRPQVYECDEDLKDLASERSRENLCLEAALVDHCDRIAYIHHDLEDGLDSAILSLDELQELEPWSEAWRGLESQFGQRFRDARRALRLRAVIHAMQNLCITDLVETTRHSLQKLALSSLDDIFSLSAREFPVGFSPEMRERTTVIQRFLFRRLYRHPQVMRMSRRGSRLIDFLFQEFVQHPDLLPGHFQDRIADAGIFRVVADYIAGMTDRFARKEFEYLNGLSERV